MNIQKLTGKNCLVTGASSGLGLEVSKQLCKLGAHVILLCHNKNKGHEAIKKIQIETPGASTDLMICDLSSIKSVNEFLEAFKRKYSKLHLLFNNAAVIKKQFTKTEDNIETMFHVNYLAPFILSNSLTNELKNTSSSRIINIGFPDEKYHLDFEDLQSQKKYSSLDSFFKTKLCVSYFSLELKKRLTKTNVEVINTDPGPGSFKSNIVREFPFVGFFKNLFAKPVKKVAENIIYLAFSNEIDLSSNNIFSGRKKQDLTDYWSDENIRQKLWSITESLTH